MIEIESLEGVTVSDWKECVEKVTEAVPLASLFDLLAEEATELAWAAMKTARVIRGENPTPVTKIKALDQVYEELSDLRLVCEILLLEPDRQVMDRKLHRWVERLKGKA